MTKLIYALELENDKYFVGATTNLNRSYSQHVNEKRFEWTTANPVVGFLFVYAELESSDEITHTRLLMKKYGVENVRGGLISNTVLNEKQLSSISKHMELLQSDMTLAEATAIRNDLTKKVKLEDMPNNHGKKWTDEDKATVRKLSADGVPKDEIAQTYGRSVKAIEHLISNSH